MGLAHCSGLVSGWDGVEERAAECTNVLLW